MAKMPTVTSITVDTENGMISHSVIEGADRYFYSIENSSKEFVKPRQAFKPSVVAKKAYLKIADLCSYKAIREGEVCIRGGEFVLWVSVDGNFELGIEESDETKFVFILTPHEAMRVELESKIISSTRRTTEAVDAKIKSALAELSKVTQVAASTTTPVSRTPQIATTSPSAPLLRMKSRLLWIGIIAALAGIALMALHFKKVNANGTSLPAATNPGANLSTNMASSAVVNLLNTTNTGMLLESHDRYIIGNGTNGNINISGHVGPEIKIYNNIPPPYSRRKTLEDDMVPQNSPESKPGAQPIPNHTSSSSDARYLGEVGQQSTPVATIYNIGGYSSEGLYAPVSMVTYQSWGLDGNFSWPGPRPEYHNEWRPRQQPHQGIRSGPSPNSYCGGFPQPIRGGTVYITPNHGGNGRYR